MPHHSWSEKGGAASPNAFNSTKKKGIVKKKQEGRRVQKPPHGVQLEKPPAPISDLPQNGQKPGQPALYIYIYIHMYNTKGYIIASIGAPMGIWWRGPVLFVGRTVPTAKNEELQCTHLESAPPPPKRWTKPNVTWMVRRALPLF